jgi:NADPH:quinone reductase-like Zn-dependent oxidoreductase
MSIEETCGPEALVVARLPVPTPGRKQVRIRAAFVGTNPLDTLADVAALHARPDARNVMGRAVIEIGGEDTK